MSPTVRPAAVSCRALGFERTPHTHGCWTHSAPRAHFEQGPKPPARVPAPRPARGERVLGPGELLAPSQKRRAGDACLKARRAGEAAARQHCIMAATTQAGTAASYCRPVIVAHGAWRIVGREGALGRGRGPRAGCWVQAPRASKPPGTLAARWLARAAARAGGAAARTGAGRGGRSS